MSDYEEKCYIFIQRLTDELANDYDIQYQHMEAFAKWNLPEEIALEWIDAEGMINVLESGRCIPKDVANILREIIAEFVLEFEKSNNSIWTHEAMRLSAFWDMQRLKAKMVLAKIGNQQSDQSGDGSMIDP